MGFKNKIEAIIKAAATNPGTEILCRDKENVSGCARKMQKLFPNSISLPVENVQPGPALSSLAETGELFIFQASIPRF